MNRKTGLLLWTCGYLALALIAGGQVAELTRWPLPSGNALPYGIGVGTDGEVYFTLSRENALELLVFVGGGAK